MEKWKQKALKLDYKKSAVRLILLVILWGVLSGVLLAANFHDRADSLKTEDTKKESVTGSEGETEDPAILFGDRQPGRESSGKAEKFQQLQDAGISVADIVLVAACGLTGILLFVGYWVLVCMWVYARADRLGANRALWMAAALIFNLIAAAALWCYGKFAETCQECGRIRKHGEAYCSRCGHSFRTKCAHCGQETEPGACYCGHCGEKMEA